MDARIEEYRARIGSFRGMKWLKKAKSGGWKEECKMKLRFGGLVIVILLVVGGVEMNPGPFSIQEEAEISEFIRKTEGRDLEVGGFMERIEKSVPSMNTTITVLSEKMDEGNKAVKGLNEGWNRMQLELDEWKKKRQERRRETWEKVRKNNLIVFGLDEGNGEREDTQKIVEQLVKKKMGIQEIQEHVDMLRDQGRTKALDPYL
jgi:hypothetical protein